MDIRPLPPLGPVEHRHGDAWYQMEERAPAHRPDDPEREWGRGRIFNCPQCDESVRILPPKEPGR